VTARKGTHVTDLQRSDFQLLEDGKPREITNFSWVEVTPPPSGARLAALKQKPSLLDPGAESSAGNAAGSACPAGLERIRSGSDGAQYICEIFGFKTAGKPPVPPTIETEVKLYRAGGPVATIPSSPVKIENAGDQRLLSGSMRIPDDLPAGNYTMEVLAYDQREPSKKSKAASSGPT